MATIKTAMQIELGEKQRDLIERMGAFYEQMGMPPTESRIMALLVVCDQTELTFDQIREVLQISKSATSNALNLLLLSQQITYRTKIGERKRYFSSNIIDWEQMIAGEMQRTFKVKNLLQEALELRTKDTQRFNDQLRNFIEFIDFIGSKMPELMEQWQDYTKGKQQNTNA